MNERFKALCGDWQLRNGDPNDHADSSYDGEVIARLGKLDAETQPVVVALGAALPRLQPYAPRLEAVCQRVAGGETNMFTGVMCGSYHDVWMELHEDLILTQGIDRGSRRQLLMPRFGRVLSAMVTPFDDDGALDLDVAAELARYLQAHGHDGLVIAGTTGEAPVLNDDERLALFAAVIEAVTIPVVAGTGTNDTAPLGAPHEGGGGARRGGCAGGLPVLQPSVAGRHRRPHAGDRGRQRPARDGVRHPDPHRSQDHDGDAAAAVPRGAEHRRPQGRRRPTPARRRRSSARHPMASRRTAATT